MHSPTPLADDELTPNKTLEDLGIGSLVVFQLIMNIEDSFGISFSEDDLTTDNFRTVASVWATISRTRDRRQP
ncbi:MAG: hypothetical protein HZB45_27125 [Mycolicibacterium rufum]|nr:hypothetical protein [Mycolicibacterium rufum]